VAENNQNKRADYTLCHADEVFFRSDNGIISMILVLPIAQIVPNPSISFFFNDISQY
jgi:hypothetical protein